MTMNTNDIVTLKIYTITLILVSICMIILYNCTKLYHAYHMDKLCEEK